MFSKLAMKNAARSVKDYLVYFLTLMFGVCLFYMFNSIDAQTAMLQVNASQQEILKSLSQIIGYVSVFIAVILGFLVVYANGFLMKRRKKELGVYMTLGMPRSRISAILILETFLIGLLSLAAGLVAGIFLAQGMSVVTAKLFEANLSKFVFTFSRNAFWKTLVYFGVMFLVVMVFNTISVSRLKLIDLLSAAHKNEKLRLRRLWAAVVVFLMSVACLVAAYYLIEKNGMFQMTKKFTASLILGVIGTVLFFLSLSGFLLRIIQSNKKLYFKGLNMFVLRQFNSKINTTFVSVSVICLMLLMTIGTLSTGLSVSQVLSRDLKAACPYDVTLIAYSPESESGSAAAAQKEIDLPAALKKGGVTLSSLTNQYAQIQVYGTQEANLSLFLTKDTWPKQYGAYNESSAKGSLMNLIPVSDFNRILALQGKSSITLAENQYAVLCNYSELAPVYEKALAAGKKITLAGKTLEPLPQLFAETYADSSGSFNDGDLVLPDSFFKNRTPAITILNFNYKAGVDVEKADSRLHEVSIDSDIFSDYSCMFTSKQEIYSNVNGSKTVAAYLALYIGLVFLIAAAAVLALQQLSEASDNAERYGLLRKLGAEDKMVNRALLKQISLYFLLPLSLAVVHSAVGIHVVNKALVTVGGMDILGNILATAAIFLVVYGAYFLATYFGSRSMLRQKELSHRGE